MSTTPMPFDIRLMQLATRALWVTAAVLLLVVGVRWMLGHSVWSVQRIVVHGDVAHQNPVTFRSHLALQRNNAVAASFLLTDLQQLREVFESVPWVRHAVVQREFPGRLRVTLTEHKAAAWWGQTGSGSLVNTDGEVFEATYDDSEELPEVHGPREQAALIWRLFGQLQPQLAAMQLELRRLELNERGSWRAQIDNGAWIELGRGTPPEVLERSERFANTLPQMTQRYATSIASVDLRYPNGYALRLRGVATLDDTTPPLTSR
jgi:cell division protein FtsQ